MRFEDADFDDESYGSFAGVDDIPLRGHLRVSKLGDYLLIYPPDMPALSSTTSSTTPLASRSASLRLLGKSARSMCRPSPTTSPTDCRRHPHTTYWARMTWVTFKNDAAYKLTAQEAEQLTEAIRRSPLLDAASKPPEVAGDDAPERAPVTAMTDGHLHEVAAAFRAAEDAVDSLSRH
jgi:hypothetical protein